MKMSRYVWLLLVVVAFVVIAALHWMQQPTAPGTSTSVTTSSTTSTTMQLTSTAFVDGGLIPALYSCDGQSINPPLTISDVPSSAKSLALLLVDPDVPKQVLPAGEFDHWVLYNIPPNTTQIPQNSSVGTVGHNGAGVSAYAGLCPPTQFAPTEHRYFFTVYALDVSTLTFLPTASSTPIKADVIQAMQGHIISQAQLMGRYQRPQ